MNFERMPRLFKNYVPDLRDNLPSSEAPAHAVESLERMEDAQGLIDQVILPATRQALVERSTQLPMGMSRARIIVGKQELGTRHPHDFVVDKRENERDFYVIDPEHQMGKSKRQDRQVLPRPGDIRPKVATLVAVTLSDSAQVQALSILRFRTEHIENAHVLKMAEQLKGAQALLHSKDLPEFLTGMERDITFHLQVRSDGMRADSRYTTPEQLTEFLHGHADSEMLKGKVWSYSHLMEHFAKHLASGRFEPISSPPGEPPH